MRGKYINTTIMMAALSGRNARKSANVKETLASTGDHKIIWSKNTKNQNIVAIAEERLSC